MKLNYISFLLFLIALPGVSQTVKPQDTIVLYSGEKVNADTIIVGTEEIEFQQKGKDSDTHDIVNISDIFMIKYRNGTTDTISSYRPKADTTRNWYFKGIESADDNYTGGKSGKTMIFFSTLIATPVLTLYPTIVCAKKPPSAEHLNIHDTTLMNNTEYMRGYKDEASDIKSRKIWKNYVLAGVLWVVVAFFVIL